MNITIDKAVLEQALAALEQINSPYWSDFVTPHIAQLREALAQPEHQSVPSCRVADIGFRWDADRQEHVPELVVEFDAVPHNRPNDSKGWIDRDALAAMIAAAQPQPHKPLFAEMIAGHPGLREELAAMAQQPQPVQEPVGWIDAKALEELRLPEMTWMPIWNRQSGNRPVALYTSPQAQPLSNDASPISVLLAVEESIKNGECPWQIEQAFDEYEAQRQSAITKGTT